MIVIKSLSSTKYLKSEEKKTKKYSKRASESNTLFLKTIKLKHVIVLYKKPIHKFYVPKTNCHFEFLWQKK